MIKIRVADITCTDKCEFDNRYYIKVDNDTTEKEIVDYYKKHDYTYITV